MKITVNVNIENSKRGWAAVANHVKHDPHQKHSNKDIESELRSLDSFALSGDYGIRKWQEDKFSAFVKAHDEKLKKQGRREKDRYYHSVQGFLGRKNRQTAVVTFGNNESWKKIIRTAGCQEGIDYTVAHEDKGNGNVYEWYKLNPQSGKVKDLRNRVVNGFSDWRKTFNGDDFASKYVHIGRYAIHFDEHGAPHMHAEMAFCGRTKKGAPTPSMSTAITQMATEPGELTPKNNREAFRIFRYTTDKVLINEMGKHFRRNGKSIFELTRTGRDTSRDMETYKATEDQRLADEKKLEQIKAQRKAEEQRLAELQQQRQNLKEREARVNKLEQENKELKQENHGLKAFKAKVEQIEEKLGVKNLEELADGIAHLASHCAFYIRRYLDLGVAFFATKKKKLTEPKRWKQAFDDYHDTVGLPRLENAKSFVTKKGLGPKSTNLSGIIWDVEHEMLGGSVNEEKCIQFVNKQVREETKLKQTQYQEPEPEEHDFGGPAL